MTLEAQVQSLWENVAFARLLRTFRLAVAPSRLILAGLTILVICSVGGLMDRLWPTVLVDTRYPPKIRLEDFQRQESRTELDAFVTDRGLRRYFVDGHRPGDGVTDRQGVFTTLWNFGAARFNQATVSLLAPDSRGILARLADVFVDLWMCVLAVYWAVRYHPLYSVVLLAVCFVAFTIGGGAICRSVALEYARGEKPGVIEVLGFSIQRFRALAAGPALSGVVMVAFGTVLLVLGAALRIPRAGELLLGLGLGLGLVFGLLTTLMLLGTTAGGSLMLPVIAFEASDGFDAVSRSFRYVFAQPWWMVFYVLIAGLVGTVSYLCVRFFVFLVLSVTYGLVFLGAAGDALMVEKLHRIWPRPQFYDLMGAGPMPVGWSEAAAAVLVRITMLGVVGLVVAYVLSFYFSASTVIYSLLRHKLDGVGPGRVYIKLDEVIAGVDGRSSKADETTGEPAEGIGGDVAGPQEPVEGS